MGRFEICGDNLKEKEKGATLGKKCPKKICMKMTIQTIKKNTERTL